MKILEQIGHQGDTQWFAVDEIPADAVKLDKGFIAKSEQSGSVHVLCGTYDMYQYGEGFCIDVKEPCVINHTYQQNVNEKNINKSVQMPPKDHRSSVIQKGTYFVGIQRRYDPFLKQFKNVQD